MIDGRNDEAKELEVLLPDVPHLQNPNRVASAIIATEELEMQVLLLDDGFQHRKIHRDLEIVLLDAREPFGFGHLLPRQNGSVLGDHHGKTRGKSPSVSSHRLHPGWVQSPDRLQREDDPIMEHDDRDAHRQCLATCPTSHSRGIESRWQSSCHGR